MNMTSEWWAGGMGVGNKPNILYYMRTCHLIWMQSPRSDCWVWFQMSPRPKSPPCSGSPIQSRPSVNLSCCHHHPSCKYVSKPWQTCILSFSLRADYVILVCRLLYCKVLRGCAVSVMALQRS